MIVLPQYLRCLITVCRALVMQEEGEAEEQEEKEEDDEKAPAEKEVSIPQSSHNPSPIHSYPRQGRFITRFYA